MTPEAIANIAELIKRNYVHRVNEYLNEDEWVKGDIFVSIHTVRGCNPGYFKALIDQTESKGYQFEVKDPLSQGMISEGMFKD